MILVDYGNLTIANLHAHLGNHTNVEISKEILRHMILNSIRALNVKFKEPYGDMVICCDSKRSWRHDVFPYYKANRRKLREKSEINWPEVFQHFADIRDEIAANFPYKVVHVEGAEADDVIAVLANHTTDESCLIVSGDHDFKQLHRGWIQQYDFIRERWIECEDPDSYLFEHILKGDSGDGIPNVRSPDNALVIGERQKPITKKLTQSSFDMIPEELRENYNRNQKLIDFTFIPMNIEKAILGAFSAQQVSSKSAIMPYLVKNQLKTLLENITDF